jgi:hypothetical protein
MIVPVVAADIDEQNHVNNTVYLRWVQDVAVAHWREIACREAQNTIGWLVLRHEIDYKAMASSCRKRARSGVHQCSNWPAGARVSGSAHAIFYLICPQFPAFLDS